MLPRLQSSMTRLEVIEAPVEKIDPLAFDRQPRSSVEPSLPQRQKSVTIGKAHH